MAGWPGSAGAASGGRSAMLVSTFMIRASWALACRCLAIRSAKTWCICLLSRSWTEECGVGKSTSTSASAKARASP